MVLDMVKIGYLRGAPNIEMQRAMIGPVTYIDYGGFVQALLAVGSQLPSISEGTDDSDNDSKPHVA